MVLSSSIVLGMKANYSKILMIFIIMSKSTYNQQIALKPIILTIIFKSIKIILIIR